MYAHRYINIYIVLTTSLPMVPIRKVCAPKIAFISLPINLNIGFVCSKGPSHGDGSFEYPQHMFWLRIKKDTFPVRNLIWRTVT